MGTEIQAQSVEVANRLRPIILVFVKYYLPGDKSGGPVRSIVNMVNQLSDGFDFRIVTSDRDWTDKQPYKGVVVDAWNQVGKAQVFYLSPNKRSLLFIAKLLSVTYYDVLYLNSFFDPDFTQKPLWVGRLGLAPKKPLIIAPRGEFSSGAYSLKYWKKALYVWIVFRIRLINKVIWHASTEHEASDIRYRLVQNNSRQVIIASDIASDIASEDIALRDGPINLLRIVFLSRISPKKNLDFALRVLAKVQVPVQFNIYGPNGEDAYWQHCNALMEKLPVNVTARYAGVLTHAEVMNVFRSHDLFLFPTRGENFGHVIMESLSAGTPVLIANTTPWQNLEQAGVGWDLPLDSEKEFVDRIHIAAQYSVKSRREWRKRVLSYAIERSADPEIIAANRRLFWEVIEPASPAS